MKLLKAILVTTALALPVTAGAQENTTETTTTTVRQERGFDWGWLGLLGLAGLLGRGRQPEVRQTTTSTTTRR